MKISKSERKVIEAKAEVMRIWDLMCDHEGVARGSRFMSFSSDNPYHGEYNKAFTVLQAAVKAEKRNRARRERHEILTSMGLKRVKGALGGVYYE